MLILWFSTFLSSKQTSCVKVFCSTPIHLKVLFLKILIHTGDLKRTNKIVQFGDSAHRLRNTVLTKKILECIHFFLTANAMGCHSKTNKPCLFPYIRNGKNVTTCIRSPGEMFSFNFIE
jgi:hypothetical protein